MSEALYGRPLHHGQCSLHSLAYKLGLFQCSFTFTPPGLTLRRPVPPFVQHTQTYDILNTFDKAPWTP